jgi:hypothetical protein
MDISYKTFNDINDRNRKTQIHYLKKNLMSNEFIKERNIFSKISVLIYNNKHLKKINIFKF